MSVPVSRRRARVGLLLLLPCLMTGAEKSLSAEGYLHLQWRHEYVRQTASNVRRASFDYGFVLRRGRVKFRYGFDERVRTELELGCDRLELKVEDAFAEYRAASYLVLKAGLYKMPFSLEELTPASRLLLAERSIVNDKFGDHGFLGRDIGFSVSGRLFERRFPLEYELGVFNGNGATAFQDDNNAKQFAERVTFRPLDRFSFGLNATQRNDSLTGRLEKALGADLVWRPGNGTVEAEVLYGDAGKDRTMTGARLLGACRLGRFEPAAQYSTFSIAREVRQSAVAGVGWTLNRRIVIKLNGSVEFRPDDEFRAWYVAQAEAKF